jgi:hypothetical protein
MVLAWGIEVGSKRVAIVQSIPACGDFPSVAASTNRGMVFPLRSAEDLSEWQANRHA